jgi:hypothetical protein
LKSILDHPDKAQCLLLPSSEEPTKNTITAITMKIHVFEDEKEK